MRVLRTCCACLLATLPLYAGQAEAGAIPVQLGVAGSFGVLAGSTVTNTGPSVIDGDLGVAAGSAIIGFPPGLVTDGAVHAGDSRAAMAQADLGNAYTAAAAQPPGVILTGQDLGGLSLTPGVYTFATSAQLTGTLTLNGGNVSGAVFLFQIGSTLTTATASSVLLTQGASGANVFWQVGSSATLGAASQFRGNILAETTITLDNSASIDCGRALARTGGVTLDNNAIAAFTCRTGALPTGVPETGSALLLATAFVIGALRTRLAGYRPTLSPRALPA